jgi:hypothetical protein
MPWSLRGDDFFRRFWRAGKDVDTSNMRQRPQLSKSKRRKPAMKKLLMICVAMCFLFAISALAFDDMGKTSTVNGWVSDDKCGAKGANDKAEACTKKCLDGGAKMVIVTDKDQKVLAVDNPDALKDHVGHHIAVTGMVKGDSIHVDSAKML